MDEMIKMITEFTYTNKPLMIRSLSAKEVFLFLNPEFINQNGILLISFESLNERGGNSVECRIIHKVTHDTLYFENNIEKMYQLNSIPLDGYRKYVQPNYFSAPDFTDEREMRRYILGQVDNQCY